MYIFIYIYIRGCTFISNSKVIKKRLLKLKKSDKKYDTHTLKLNGESYWEVH